MFIASPLRVQAGTPDALYRFQASGVLLFNKIELSYIISMNSNDYLTNTLLNNLVGMNYRGKAVIEARIMPYSECQEFTDVILVRYGQGEIHEKLFIHPAYVRYSYLTPERILLVERLGGGFDAEYNFTK